MKSQSAMEYLTTYGWAILIIGIALIALWGLGVFNPLTFSAKASPGSCSVYRPQGVGTTSEMALNGVCTSNIPQFVTVYASTTCPVSMGNLDPILVPQLSTTSATAITETFWINQAQTGTGSYVYLSTTSNPVYCAAAGGNLQCTALTTAATGPTPIKNNQWFFGAFTITSSGVETVYVNGQPGSSVTGAATNWGTAPATLTMFNMFSTPSSATCADASMSNVQLYSTALSSNSIEALYLEGIGGTPIDLQDLVGWWPLNGGINDYSGNNNNAVSNSISYNGGWWGSFTNP